jgi:hypothetical protein
MRTSAWNSSLMELEQKLSGVGGDHGRLLSGERWP